MYNVDNLRFDRAIFYERMRFTMHYVSISTCSVHWLLRKSMISSSTHQYEIQNVVERTH